MAVIIKAVYGEFYLPGIIAPLSPVEVNGCSRTTHHLLLQGQRVSHVRIQHEARSGMCSLLLVIIVIVTQFLRIMILTLQFDSRIITENSLQQVYKK
jgi:hypothetical protein